MSEERRSVEQELDRAFEEIMRLVAVMETELEQKQALPDGIRGLDPPRGTRASSCI
jgi:hypothetical protein